MPRRAPWLGLRAILIAPDEVQQDAFADAAIGDAQAADRPELADRLEDRAAGEHEIGALGADAGIARALVMRLSGEATRGAALILETQHHAVDAAAAVVAELEMHGGERRHRAGGAKHLNLPRGDARRDALALLDIAQRRVDLGDHRGI